MRWTGWVRGADRGHHDRRLDDSADLHLIGDFAGAHRAAMAKAARAAPHDRRRRLPLRPRDRASILSMRGSPCRSSSPKSSSGSLSPSGFTTLTGLIVLAWTSTDGWQRRFGAGRSCIASFISSAFSQSSTTSAVEAGRVGPTVMAGIFVWLIGCRLVSWRLGRGSCRSGPSPPSASASACSRPSAKRSALARARRALDLVLPAHLTLDAGLSPAAASSLTSRSPCWA